MRHEREPQSCAPSLNCGWFRAISATLVLLIAMPTYEYFCEKCKQNFDAFQSMRDEPFKECPKELCRKKKWGHGKVKRLLGTGAGLIFKGSGFYTTDYRSSSYKEAAKKESAGGAAEKAGGTKESGGTAKESPKPADGGKPKKDSSA
jgi:putative FmdB family regulatory protein